MLRGTIEAWRTDGRTNGSGFDPVEFFSGGASYSRAVEMTFREVAAADPGVLEGAISLLSHLSTRHELELAALMLSFLTQQPQHRDSGHEAQTLGICAVTVATAFKPALVRLNASLAANGIELFVLGIGVKWGGHGLKLLLLERFLAVEDVRSHARFSHVLFLDAYDTLVLEMATPSLILSRYLAFGAGVVFNGETECAPDPQLQQAFWPRNRYSLPPLPYLNSGVYFGDVETIRRMLDEVFVDMRTSFGLGDFDGMSKADDQRFLSRWFLRQEKETAKVDTSGFLFHSLHGFSADDFTLSPEILGRGVVWSKASRTSPLVLHGNGNGCAALLDLVGKLEQKDWPPEDFRRLEPMYPPMPEAGEKWVENDARLQCIWPYNSYVV